jgi:acyl-CoA thioesterase II
VSTAVENLIRLLTLEPVDEDAYEAVTPGDGPTRLFGGQVAAQSLRAATLTVEPERRAHSLHAYFVRPGRPGTPLSLQVVRVRDGRSFATRFVTASQGGEAIFVLAASFHIDEEGEEWQPPMRDDVPGPDDPDAPESPLSPFATMHPFEMRPAIKRSVTPPWPMHPFWVRVRAPLPDDPALHACALTFISDMGVVGSARKHMTNDWRQMMGASLDHAMWFHRPARADEWLLFDVVPASNAGARGLARGTMHTADGVLVASISQEALLRPAGTVPIP